MESTSHVGCDSPWQDSVVKSVAMKAEDLAVAMPYFPQELKILVNPPKA